jgi:hypothetical protein
MLVNSLDPDAKHISISLSLSGDYYQLSISDDGSKRLSEADVKMLFDFTKTASSKRGIYRVQRGALGNALKCIFGYSYSIPESQGLIPRDIVIRSHGVDYTVRLMPDRIHEVIDSPITTSNTTDDGYNTFVVAYPKAFSSVKATELIDLITATSIINPNREIRYEILGCSGQLGKAGVFKIVEGYTSVLWYREREFVALFEDYVRAKSQLAMARFISMFKGYTGREKQIEILQSLNAALDHDSSESETSQFFPNSPISSLRPEDIRRIYSTMREGSTPLSPRSVPESLGVVGKTTLTNVSTSMGWRGLRYGSMVETYTGGEYSFPYIVEVAVFDRASDDTGGLKVYRCVNFMASNEKIFSADFSIEHHLGLVGIKQDTPVTLILHIVSPRVEWLNYAKSGMWVGAFNDALRKLLNRVLPIPKTTSLYREKPPPPPKSWIPRGRIGNSARSWTRIAPSRVTTNSCPTSRRHRLPRTRSCRTCCYSGRMPSTNYNRSTKQMPEPRLGRRIADYEKRVMTRTTAQRPPLRLRSS